MKPKVSIYLVAITAALLCGCVFSALPPRIEQYVGPPGEQATLAPKTATAGIDTALMVVNDISAKDSAPPLSAAGLTFVTDQTRQRLEGSLPIKVVKMIAPAGPSQPPGLLPFQQIGREQGVEYLVVAVFSGAEVERADQLPLGGSQEGGGALGLVPGYSTSNHALVELALIQAKTGRSVIRAEGRAYATLDRLASGVTSNVYPVIRRSGRMARVFPPRDKDQAHDVLRSLAGDEALEQAVYHMKLDWDRRDGEPRPQ